MSTIHSLASISNADLATVSGGATKAATSWDKYTAQQRASVMPAYKTIVCTGAGVKGAPDLAKGVYGTGASDADRIRGAEMLKGFCMGGSQLPAAAPKTPF